METSDLTLRVSIIKLTSKTTSQLIKTINDLSFGIQNVMLGTIRQTSTITTRRNKLHNLSLIVLTD